MNYTILLNLTLGLFSTITAMEKTTSKNFHTWVLTNDIKIVKVNKPIVDQSNLITVLSKSRAPDISPIKIPVNKAELKFFCNSITKSSSYLVKNLSDEKYSLLMDIAEKLKSPLFYAELMEQLMPIQDLLNMFALNYINFELKAKLKKIIYKKYLKRIRINDRIRSTYHENSMQTLSIIFSNNGEYFTETILTPHDKFITYLWDARTLSRIEKFHDCETATFSPKDDYIVIGEGLYFIKKKSCRFIDLCNHNKPLISPDGCFLVQNSKSDTSYILCNTKTLSTKHFLSKPHYDQTNFCFHPDNKTLLYSRGIYSNDLTIYDLEKPNNQCTKIYSETPQSSDHRNKIAINTKGSLVLLNHNTLLNIQNLHSPTIIKEWEFNRKIQCFYNAFFIPNKNIIIYQPDETTFYLINESGDTIKKHESLVTNIVTDNTGNYLAFLTLDKKNKTPETINLWNLSDLPSKIRTIKINTNTYINKIEFTKDQLLVTQSYTTKVWDMNGDPILNLGPSKANAINPKTGSIVTSNTLGITVLGTFKSRKKIPGPKKMNYFNINAPEAVTTINRIIKSLTLSQALLLNKHFSHKKTKNKRQFYPNLPDGRTLASFTEKDKFLIKNFELHTKTIPSKKQF
jgi:hypothetical protein